MATAAIARPALKRQRFGFVGPSYTPYSQAADIQRTVNLYPEIVESGQGKSRIVLVGTPGLQTLVSVTSASLIKAIYYDTATGRTFVVALRSDNSVRLVEINLSGTETDRGQLAASGGTSVPASISSNGTQLLVINPETTETAHIFNLSTNVLTNVTGSVANGEPVWGQFLDGYFIALGRNGKIYLSALNDGTTWNALDVATPESSPDKAKTILAAFGELWIFGDESKEVWFNSGNADFPFEPIANATDPIGILYAYSAQVVGDMVLWVSRGKDGRAQVVGARGYRPERVSNHAVETSLQGIASVGAQVPVSWSYQQHGHRFYVLTFPTAGVTWCYDTTFPPEIGWHERSWLNGTTEEAHLGRCAAFAGGEDGATSAYLVGDRRSGNVYKMDLNILDDAGGLIQRTRRARHISDGMRQAIYHRLELDVEQGSSQALYKLRYSDNGGKLWRGPISVVANTSTVKEVTAVAIAGGGSGYAVDDILTVVGGTGTAATLRVTSVSGGVIDGIAIETGGRYTVDPTNPVSVTGGSGAGATFNLTLAQINSDLNPTWRRLGAGRDRVFEITSDSSIKHVWLDAYLDMEWGIH